MTFRTRFAPSPTGPLHLGHAYSALLAYDMAKARNGEFLLRIEDIDHTRARPEWEELIYEDLAWLGIAWVGPPMRQSDRLDAYRDALHHLWHVEQLLYPCSCKRKDIEQVLSAPQEGVTPSSGPDGLVYPGTCRAHSTRTGAFPTDQAIRLDMTAALEEIGSNPIEFTETGQPAENTQKTFTYTSEDLTKYVGDIILSRKDFLGSYHLSVVLDDAEQKITHVVRGEDLFDATQIHVVLQKLLKLPTPAYHHHKLIRDDTGKRLAKRDDARAIRKYREDGYSPEDIRELVGLTPSV